MNGLKIMAIVLIAVGIGVLMYGKFSYTKELTTSSWARSRSRWRKSRRSTSLSGPAWRQ